MRIALVHSYYRSQWPSGENRIVDLQVEQLRAQGHEVGLVSRHSDDERRGPVGSLGAAWSVATGTGPDPTRELRDFSPDVVHVHNLFPNFATTWLESWPGPLVATLHNFRSVCGKATLFRDGHICTDCPDGDRWAGVRHGCYRQSRVATLPLAWRNRRGIAADPVVDRADRLIVLSPRALSLFTGFGVPVDRIRLVPNGMPAPEDALASATAERWVALGRLSEEKELGRLLERWPAGFGLDVIGAGPQEAELRRTAPADVRFLGGIPREQLTAVLPTYRGAVLSGTNHESAYPLAAVEALSYGVPLVARAGSVAAEMVAAWGCGIVFDDTTLLDALRKSASDPRLRTAASRAFAQNFTADSWIPALLGVYAEAIELRS